MSTIYAIKVQDNYDDTSRILEPYYGTRELADTALKAFQTGYQRGLDRRKRLADRIAAWEKDHPIPGLMMFPTAEFLTKRARLVQEFRDKIEFFELESREDEIAEGDQDFDKLADDDLTFSIKEFEFLAE